MYAATPPTTPSRMPTAMATATALCGAGKYFLVVYSCTTFMRMYVTSSNIVAELKRRAIQAQT
jgi:hypothetical protein